MKKELIPTAIAAAILATAMSAGAMAAGLNGQQPHVLYGFNGQQGEANAPKAVASGSGSATPAYRQVSGPLYGINGPRFGREVPGWADK